MSMNIKGFKKLVSAFVVLSIVIALSGCAVTKSVTLATVDDEIVTLNDFYQYYDSIKATMLSEAQISTLDQEAVDNFWKSTEIEGKNALTVAKERALNEAVKVIVQNKKAKEMNISLSEEDKKQIDEYKTAMIKQSYGSKSSFLEELKSMKSTEAAFDKAVTGSFISLKLYTELSKGEEYTIDKDKAIEELKAGDKVTAKHILIATTDSKTNEPYSDEKKNEAKKLAEETLKKIKNGADFDTLMNELSEDPGTAQNPEGYTFGKGEMVEPFENAAFALKENEVSEVVESSYGYHIIKRVPLIIEDADIENQIAKMQQDIYDEQVEKWKADFTINIDEKALKKIK